MAKAIRLDCPLDIESIRSRIRDIAGVRIICSFVTDAYWLADIITSQPDVTLVESKDYIAAPKPNGNRSLYLRRGRPAEERDPRRVAVTAVTACA